MSYLSEVLRLSRKRWILSILTYGLTNVLGRAVSGVLTVLYAFWLSPTDMGALGLLLSLAMLVDVLSNLGITQAIIRSYYDVEGDRLERLRFLRRSVVFARAAGLVLTPSLCIAAIFVWESSAGQDYDWRLYVPLTGLLAYATRSNKVFDTLSRVLDRPGEFAVNRLLQASLLVIGSSVAVFWLGLGVLGAACSLAFSVAIAAIWRTLRFSRILPTGHRRFDRQEALALVRYGVALVPRDLAEWGRLAAVRLIIAIHLSVAQVGLFFVAASVVSIPALATSAIEMWLNPQYMKLRSRGDAVAHARLARIRQVMIAALTPAFVAATLYLPSLLASYFPPRYVAAAPLVPWLLLASFIQIQSQFQIRQLLFLKKTVNISTVATISVGVNLLFAYAAAVMGSLPAVSFGTAAATLVGLILARRVTHRYEPCDVSWSLSSGSILLVVIAAIPSSLPADIGSPIACQVLKVSYLVLAVGVSLLILTGLRTRRH